jgi:hypothetical protein
MTTQPLPDVDAGLDVETGDLILEQGGAVIRIVCADIDHFVRYLGFMQWMRSAELPLDRLPASPSPPPSSSRDPTAAERKRRQREREREQRGTA